MAALQGAEPRRGSVLGWVDREGDMTLLSELAGLARAPRLSPDGRAAVFHYMGTSDTESRMNGDVFRPWFEELKARVPVP